MTGGGRPLALEDVRREFAVGGWTVSPEQFCFLAWRHPTPSSEEVVTGQNLDQLAAKLRAETDEELAAGTGGLSMPEARSKLAAARDTRAGKGTPT